MRFEKLEILEKCSNNTMIVVYRTTIDFICVSLAFQNLEILKKCSNNTLIVVYRITIDFIRISRKMQQQCCGCIGLILTTFVPL